MSEDDFYTPTDIDQLRMENDLLAFEVQFLKSRLGNSAKIPASQIPLSRRTHLEEAEKDLVLLLRRIQNSPLGLPARFNANFRTLEGRYLTRPQSLESLPSAQQDAYLEGAEKDLRLLLRRLGRWPLGVVFRRRRSFRILQERYL